MRWAALGGISTEGTTDPPVALVSAVMGEQGRGLVKGRSLWAAGTR